MLKLKEKDQRNRCWKKINKNILWYNRIILSVMIAFPKNIDTKNGASKHKVQLILAHWNRKLLNVVRIRPHT